MSGEPNNQKNHGWSSYSSSGEDCVVVSEFDWKWNDIRCDVSKYYICMT